ncbi:MAG: response regulator [Oscillochloridaceae bacterium]|nr:response regulator [Chloroflexaceae bacterium]MDW8391216.1 response regulator [Oscillochloridaceae bacterium]
MTTVLLVEDYAPNNRLLSFVLEQNGYAVICARDGVQALECLQMMPVDVIITDLLMPRLNGFELAERVRADARYNHLPIIVVTASGKESDAVRAERAGVDVFLTKPVESEDLLQVVARAVAHEHIQSSQVRLWRHSRVA